MKNTVLNVSFIIPAYNEEKLIGKCIKSVQNEIERITTLQKATQYKSDLLFNNFEIIVVDNNSTDDTIKVAHNLGVNKVITCNMKGLTRARQAGYENALYSIQAYVDSDMVIPPNWLDNLKVFTDPNVLAVSGPQRYYDMPKLFDIASRAFYVVGQISHYFSKCMLQGGNFVVRREALIKIGGHPTNIEFYGEDTALGKGISRYGKVKFLTSMWAWSSPRRFKNQGIIKTTYQYVINYLWGAIFEKVITKNYEDFRK